MNVIPAIDLRDGQCVRLMQGDFGKQTHYSGDPLALARAYEAIGFDSLHIVDLDGARTGEQVHQPVVRQIAESTNLKIQLGGGIRTSSTLNAWLANGVKRCVVGSVAIRSPDVVKSWLDKAGPDAIVLALDVRITDEGSPLLATDGWTQTTDVSLWQCVEEYCLRGARHVLCTDISRDGAMSGPNIELYTEFIRRYPDIRLQASGGVRNLEDLRTIKETGAAAAVTGRALLDGYISDEEIRSFLRAA